MEMGQKKEVKLKDIASALGISIVSVSNALNGRKGVSPELRHKVQKTAEELGYEFSKTTARHEAGSYCIGVMIAERYVKEFPSFYMEVYKQVAQAAAKRGSLVVLEIIDTEKEELNNSAAYFTNMAVHGIIFLGEMNMDFIRQVKAGNPVPTVGIDFYDVDETMDYIIPDSFHGMQAVTQRMIDAGHRDIAFLGNPYATESILDRYMGYCMALEMNGIRERADRVIPDRKKDKKSYWIDFELPGELPEAFVANCDKSAYILINKLRQRGIRVPEDISVAGFDHSYPPEAEELQLTTYESDSKALARAGVNTLLKRMEKGEGAGVIQIVAGQIIEGNTVRKIR